ncbi:MAG TPA: winged helix-turn-helix domain-containing protein [Thermoleophilaceae bacterium]
MSNASTKQKPKPKTTPKPKVAPKPKAAQRGPREGSTMWAAMEVLRGKRTPMTAGEIYTEIRKRKLAPGLKGKTPQATLAAQLAVNAKRGRYVERTEPGKFRLKRGA